ncbi:MAG: hypothetical protein WKF30_17360, partial [Pyrinomonadaceae bacterium]
MPKKRTGYKIAPSGLSCSEASPYFYVPSNLTQGAAIKFQRAEIVSLRWVIGARADLVWFIGSVLSSYLLLILYAGGILPLLPMMAAWAILIDAPHVFATFSRTYFDREERRARKWLLAG